MKLFRVPARGLVVAALVWTALVAVPSAAQSSATATIKVPCNVASLVTAINDGNAAGSARLRLAPGCTYTVSTPNTATDAFPVVTGDLEISGGKGTILDRDTGAPQFRLLNVAPAASLRLENVTVQNGSTAALGGGILNAGTLTVSGVTFANNQAANGAGLANTAGATARLKGVVFVANTTTSVGGGAFINFATLTVNTGEFRGNTAPINGGAVNTQPGGATTIKNGTFEDNISGSLGGALSNLGSTTLIASTIRHNQGSGGGGIATGNANVFLKGSTKFVNNTPTNCNPVDTIPGCAG
jgi:hypothetical protein